MEDLVNIAIDYFNAFSTGKLEEVNTYLATNAMVQLGEEAPQEAVSYFKTSAPYIETLSFEMHGIRTATEPKAVIIHFTFYEEIEKGKTTATDGLDIIEFNSDNKIQKITVLIAEESN